MFNILKKMTNSIKINLPKNRSNRENLESTLKDVYFYKENFIQNLNKDQKELYDKMIISSKLQLHLPTGVGKGFMMRTHIKNSLIENLSKPYSMLVMSHRLRLNNQHFNDIFEDNWFFLDKIVFIIIGCKTVNLNPKNLNLLNIYNGVNGTFLNKNDLIIHYKELDKLDNLEKVFIEQLKLNKKVVFISTYQSSEKIKNLIFNETHLDEVHVAATKFGKNLPFISKNSNKFFSYTATPKDLCGDNFGNHTYTSNVELFGERVGPSYKESVEKGYIPEPNFILLETANTLDRLNPIEQCRIINEAFNYHQSEIKNRVITDKFKELIEKLKKEGKNTELPNPKLLVKCFGTCKDMENTFKELVKYTTLKNINICMSHGGSDEYGLKSNYIIYKNSKSTPYQPDEYIDKLVELSKNNESMIVLHINQLTEGLNINGFTALCLMPKSSLDIAVTIFLQNCGRINRVDNRDRDNITDSLIEPDEKDLWFKPYSTIIIPYYNEDSEKVKNELINLICELRYNTKFDGFDKVNNVLLDSLTGNKTNESPFEILDEDGIKKDKIKGVNSYLIQAEDLKKAYETYLENRNEEIKKAEECRKIEEKNNDHIKDTLDDFLDSFL